MAPSTPPTLSVVCEPPSYLPALQVDGNRLTGFPAFVKFLARTSGDCECAIGGNQWGLGDKGGGVELDGVIASELWAALEATGAGGAVS